MKFATITAIFGLLASAVSVANGAITKGNCAWVCSPTMHPTRNPTKFPTKKATPKPSSMPTFGFKLPCTKPYNLIVVVDQTGSIEDNNYETLLPKVTSFLTKLDIKPLGVNAALVEVFRAKAVIKVDLNHALSTNKAGFINFVKKQPYYGGWTNLPAVAQRIREVIDAYPENRKVYSTFVVMFSDGYPQMPEVRIAPLRLQTRNAFHNLKTTYSNLYFQCIGYGSKFYSMPANQGILTYISQPNPIATVANLKPYNGFIRNLISPVCVRKSAEASENEMNAMSVMESPPVEEESTYPPTEY